VLEHDRCKREIQPPQGPAEYAERNDHVEVMRVGDDRIDTDEGENGNQRRQILLRYRQHPGKQTPGDVGMLDEQQRTGVMLNINSAPSRIAVVPEPGKRRSAYKSALGSKPWQATSGVSLSAMTGMIMRANEVQRRLWVGDGQHINATMIAEQLFKRLITTPGSRRVRIGGSDCRYLC
jgi:hypothetical protein